PSLRTPHSPRRNPHSFPTRRSSDLPALHAVVEKTRRMSGRGGGEDGGGAAGEEEAKHGRVLVTIGRHFRDGCHMRRVYDSYASLDRKSTRLNSSHVKISYAVFCLKK